MGRENLLVAAIGICEAKLDGFGFDSPTQHEKEENFFLSPLSPRFDVVKKVNSDFLVLRHFQPSARTRRGGFGNRFNHAVAFSSFSSYDNWK